MILGIKTMDDFELKGKTVLLRVDINSPIDAKTRRIKDDTRIAASCPTLRELSEKGAKTVVLAHQADPMDYQNFTTLDEHAALLQQRLGLPVRFIDDVAGPAARDAIRALKNGEILLLDNVRIHTEETIIFEKELNLPPAEQARSVLVSRLAPLADVYLCDAFAAVHRSEPSLVAFQQLLPSGCGRLFEQELRALTEVRENPKRPCVYVLGGAKILDAFSMMDHVLKIGAADKVLVAGLAGQIMLIAAGYDLGAPNMEFMKKKNLEQFIGPAKKLLSAYPGRVLYPGDVATAEPKRAELAVASLPTQGLIKDIGHKTCERYCKIIAEAGTIFMNGPAGVYEEEETAYGTKTIWEAVADSRAYSVIGGGDTIAASKRFGVIAKMSYVCTGGGALVLFLSGQTLPVVEALQMAALA